MNKIFLFALLVTLTNICFSSEIDGYVYLDNSSNHSDITIEFNPVSPSAVYAESSSNSEGFFSLSVVDGIYEIVYQKNGYQTYTLYNQFINGDTTLESVTLNSNTIVNVSGDVSGNWTSNNTYIVDGDITVPAGQTLTIEAGTEIRFDGYYSLIVEGTLSAIGNEENNIKFTSNTTSPSNSDWNQIQINNSSTTSEMKFCIIEYGNDDDNNQTGLIEVQGNVIIENSKIRHSDAAGVRIAYTYSGDVSVENCEIYDCKQGIYSSGEGELIVENNYIHDMEGIGVRCWSESENTIVQNNKISFCTYGVITFEDLSIERNIFFENYYGIYVSDGQPSILNNTFFDNQNGIGINDNDYYNPEPIINSNIFSNNIGYDIKSDGEFMPTIVAYNLFYNSGSGIGNNLPVGVGSIVTVNNNGTESDTYYNIFSDPNFISINSEESNFCELDSASDAIDAGDPEITNDYNSTIIDMGAKETGITIGVKQYAVSEFKVFPNPMVNKLEIKAKGDQAFNKIQLFTINGVKVKEYNMGNQTNEYTLTDIHNLIPGIYFVNIYCKFGSIERIKVIKQ